MEFESIDIETFRFDVVRKGYDRLQVENFLQKISNSMARLEERSKLAEVRSELAAREVEDLRARAETTIQETVAARARMIAASPERQVNSVAEAPSGLTAGQATIEAQNIIEQANSHATSIHAEAEAVLADALSASSKIHGQRDEVLGSVGAERATLIAAASEEADDIRAAALEDAKATKAAANAKADEVRRLARADASSLIEDARKNSSEHAAPAPAMAIPFATPSYAEESDEIAIDLREDATERELEHAVPTERASRYKSRSANLPSLGDDAGSVIGSLEALRAKEPTDE